MVDYQIYWPQIVWVVAAPFEMWIVPSRWPNPKNDLGHLSWRNGKGIMLCHVHGFVMINVGR